MTTDQRDYPVTNEVRTPMTNSPTHRSAVQQLHPSRVAPVSSGLRLVEDAPPAVSYERVDSLYVRAVKPCVDRITAVTALVVLSPLLFAVAAAVRFKLGPGVIYRQPRVGRHGRTFNIIKFRSMDPERRTVSGPFVGVDRRRVHKSDDDPRHSAFGRLLRSTSVDELPQLLNVAMGHMSLIGPRPELASVADQYNLWNHNRHLVKPGITGAWQISEHRHELLHKNMHIDVEYLDEISARTDARILLSTIGAMKAKTGA